MNLTSLICCLCAAYVVSGGPVDSLTNETSTVSIDQGSISCHEVRQIFAMKQIGSAQLVQNSQINGESNELCPSTKSCCNPQMEQKYTQAVNKDLASMLQTASSYLKTLIATSATKFSKTFTDLLAHSENQTLTLFADVYKAMEPAAKGLVVEFYSNLTAYVAGGLDFDVEDRVADFFDGLFPLVYHHVINPKLKDFSEDFKECLRETRDEIRPFDGVPQDLATNLDRSLGLAKVFLQALSLGVEVINTTEHMDFGPECGKALVKLTYCPHCRGVVSGKPCGAYCLNVIRGCLAQVAELDRPWADFINALERMASGFVRTYNLEEVTSRMHSDLSTAIMNAMQMGPDLSKKVKLACGNPRRAARDVSSKTSSPPSNNTDTTTETDISTSTSGLSIKSARAAGEEPLVERLQNFARKLGESKSFFGSLSDKLCSEDHLSTRNDKCWNGHEFAEYYKTIAGVGLAALKYNPEFRPVKNGTVSSMIPLSSSPVPILVDKLRHLKQVLNDKALSVPQGDSIYNGEGSGSGAYNRFDSDDEDFTDASGSGDDTGTEGGETKPKNEEDFNFDQNNKRKKTLAPKGNGSESNIFATRDNYLVILLATLTSLVWSHRSLRISQ